VIHRSVPEFTEPLCHVDLICFIAPRHVGGFLVVGSECIAFKKFVTGDFAMFRDEGITKVPADA
jgi:hypothetical protein